MSPAEPDLGPDSGPGPGPDHGFPGRPVGEVYDWYVRGLAMLESGHPQAATVLLARVAEVEGPTRSVSEALGRAHFDSRRFAEAAEAFAAIVEAHPDDHYARFGLGLSAARLGDFARAAEHLALAVAMRPDLDHYERALREVRATIEARRGTR